LLEELGTEQWPVAQCHCFHNAHKLNKNFKSFCKVEIRSLSLLALRRQLHLSPWTENDRRDNEEPMRKKGFLLESKVCQPLCSDSDVKLAIRFDDVITDSHGGKSTCKRSGSANALDNVITDSKIVSFILTTKPVKPTRGVQKTESPVDTDAMDMESLKKNNLSELRNFSNKNGYDINKNGDSGPLLLGVLDGFLKFEVDEEDDEESKRNIKTMGVHDDEVGSSRPKRSQQYETVEEAMHPHVHHPYLLWEGCNQAARSRYNTRLGQLLLRLIYSVCVLDWNVLNQMGCGEEIDEMLTIKLFMADTNEEIFTSEARTNAFNIDERIYSELCHEFYSTYEFDEVCASDELNTRKIIKFRLCGRAYSWTLLKFAKRLGLYNSEEIEEEGFDVYFQGGLRRDGSSS
ncbi:hypothetical protein Tco_0593797, partial [Tanacetum coccineum]